MIEIFDWEGVEYNCSYPSKLESSDLISIIELGLVS